jgi:fructosamine-3-kinase
MIPPSLQKQLQQFLTLQLDSPVTSLEFNAIGGGSINQTFQLLLNNKQHLFCKINSADRFPLFFKKEKKGLELLSGMKLIKIPKAIGLYESDQFQVLVLEWVTSGRQSGAFWKKFGESMAFLHRCTHLDFGLEEDNYIGALPQYNKQNLSWIDFFIHQRLEPQISRAVENRLLSLEEKKKFETLYSFLPDVFSDEPPALLHGDLWNGNFICNAAELPVLIDPAVYYGNRNMDLAMTKLFGGFDKAFYEAYDYHYPFSLNSHQQWQVCNLYPLLVHLNLFGRGYLKDILHTLNSF